MKLISTFLAFLILGLIATPCTDTEASATTETVEIALFDTHDQQDMNGDFCSPFCSCHCCHTHLIPDFDNMNEAPIYPRDLGLGYFNSQFPEPHFRIFQPPKIS